MADLLQPFNKRFPITAPDAAWHDLYTRQLSATQQVVEPGASQTGNGFVRGEHAGQGAAAA
ncbi:MULTISPECIES: hypothetical protein [Roseiflexus]|uniref:hypothetical protein n=1 Tax=Roseiflexus TaxID=120961 RepID=UPI00059C5919|nr:MULTISPECIES: hypothetical protein [Roseiflexus]